MIIKTERDYTRVSDEEWLRLSAKLKTIAGIYVGSDRTCRRFIDGVLWILRVGGQWRSLPAERGRWNSVFKRFSRWSFGANFMSGWRKRLICKRFRLIARSRERTLAQRERRQAMLLLKHWGDHAVDLAAKFGRRQQVRLAAVAK